MRKSDIIRAIYAELRLTVADDIPDGDLLRFAHMIVQSHLLETDPSKDLGRAGVTRSLWSLDVFDAMRDGGWRVLEFEGRSTSARDDPDGVERCELRNLIQRFLGPEWQHHQWNGLLSPQ